MKNNIDYTLYLVTDNHVSDFEKFCYKIEKAICNGVTTVQLREKNLETNLFYKKALKVKELTDKYNVPLIINDRIDIMLAIDAAGVHLGQSDMPADIARKIIGQNKILGISASNLTEAKKAYEDGADYLGVGAMFATQTKPDADVTSMKELKKIRENVDIPIVVIGGINCKTISLFSKIKVDGFAVVSAIMSEKDSGKASKDLIEEIQKLKIR
ncbi:MAG: thiamine phosphate synthase [Dialister micraerophilus]|uniref:thiamine phosphate synthase n=1 Tax=Dialister micraerophilus TaxID=309120 RepID=UPI00254C4C73|nr:thiamine phosphate synthase [Dialister micraerophilus]MDK8253564.1 thiamine phosphate synthase [Dialister micraerophilus]